MNTSTIFFGLMNRHNDLFIKIPREHLNNFSAACRTGIIGIAERDRGQGAVVSVRKKAGHRHFFTIDSNIFWNFRKLQNFEENIKNVFPNYLNKCDDTFFVARQTSAGWSLDLPAQDKTKLRPRCVKETLLGGLKCLICHELNTTGSTTSDLLDTRLCKLR